MATKAAPQPSQRTLLMRMHSGYRSFIGLPPVIENEGDRIVYGNNAQANELFCDNTVITSKYTWYNFVPLFLLEQFMRFANAYFLLVSILQCIPGISITNGLPTNLIPLSIVLTFDGVVTAREDYKRHTDDALANASTVLAMREGAFRTVLWRDVRVGDILKIVRNSAVPADCVFLSSTSSDNATPDTCYVQTAQLDGETNLKLRQAIPATVSRFRTDTDCASFRGYIRCEAPNAAFDKFVGVMHLAPVIAEYTNVEQGVTGPRPVLASGRGEGANGGLVSPGIAMIAMAAASRGGEAQLPPAMREDALLPLEAEQTLLRGSIIRNVDYVYAVAVYTGRETKVRVRQTTRVMKRAQVETEINRFIVLLLLLLIALCITGTAGADAFLIRRTEHPYLDTKLFTAADGLRQLFTYFLLNAGFIPVSLYVTVRLARSFQMFFMEKDIEMYHCEPELVKRSGGLEGEYPFKVRTMDLNDELGQITHIFSDKTGTLTLNYMEFRKMLINGVAYGIGTTQIGIDRMRREGQDVTAVMRQMEASKARVQDERAVPHVSFEDGSETHPGRTVGNDARNPRDGAQGTAIHEFFLHLALNHTVLREVVRDNAGAIVGSRLSASSPDEEAFLCAAERFGYTFETRSQDTVTLQCRFPVSLLPLHHDGRGAPPPSASTPCTLTFRVLYILAYSQERKRMSVIVEHPSINEAGEPRVGGGEIVLYCKGADSVILPRLSQEASVYDAQARKLTRTTLSEWGSDGLRTLVFAAKKLSRAEFTTWSAQYNAACTDIDQIRKRKSKQPNAIDMLMDQMEVGMTLQGATANEDKLQPEVPETISLLSRAGMKVWMVTGDKQETAVNIGFATRLLDDSMRQIVATVDSAGNLRNSVKRIRVAAKRMRQEMQRDASMAANSRSNFQGAVDWADKQLEALETRMGFSVPFTEVTEIPAPMAEPDEVTKPASSPQPQASWLSFGSRGTPQATPAAGPEPPRIGTSRASRADSFASEEGEVEMTGDLDKPTSASATTTDAAAVVLHGGDACTPASHGVGVGNGMHSNGGSYMPPDVPGADAPGKADPRAPRSLAISIPDAQSHGLPAVKGLSTRARGDGSRTSMSRAASTGAFSEADFISRLTSPLLGPQRRPYALIVDEATLDAALGHPKARAYLLFVSVNCGAVICCRARPDQKARVVKLIREGVPYSRTLAIGDGANDVDMIRQAHVGVGISGAEGVQAANASDYSIGRFRYLQRLLLVHGRWNYTRMSRLVLYTFYKNLVFVTAQFWFSTLNGFSGQKYYVELGTQTFNLLYTSLPILIMAIYDHDFDAALSLRFPLLYDFGRLGRGLNIRVFMSWFSGALLEAAIVFIVVRHTYELPDLYPATPYVFQLGSVIFSAVVAVVSMRIAMETYNHHFVFQFFTFGSAILWLPAAFVFDAMSQDGMFGGMIYVFGCANFWFTIALVLAITAVRTMAWKAWKRATVPTFRQVLQECAQVTHDFTSADQFAEAADIARRTGKTVADVYRAASVANEAHMRLATAGVISPTPMDSAYASMSAAGGRSVPDTVIHQNAYAAAVATGAGMRSRSSLQPKVAPGLARALSTPTTGAADQHGARSAGVRGGMQPAASTLSSPSHAVSRAISGAVQAAGDFLVPPPTFGTAPLLSPTSADATAAAPGRGSVPNSRRGSGGPTTGEFDGHVLRAALFDRMHHRADGYDPAADFDRDDDGSATPQVGASPADAGIRRERSDTQDLLLAADRAGLRVHNTVGEAPLVTPQETSHSSRFTTGAARMLSTASEIGGRVLGLRAHGADLDAAGVPHQRRVVSDSAVASGRATDAVEVAVEHRVAAARTSGGAITGMRVAEDDMSLNRGSHRSLVNGGPLTPQGPTAASRPFVDIPSLSAGGGQRTGTGSGMSTDPQASAYVSAHYTTFGSAHDAAIQLARAPTSTSSAPASFQPSSSIAAAVVARGPSASAQMTPAGSRDASRAATPVHGSAVVTTIHVQPQRVAAAVAAEPQSHPGDDPGRTESRAGSTDSLLERR